MRAGLHCTYDTEDLLAAVRALWLPHLEPEDAKDQPAETNVLRTLFVRELRKRWLDLAAHRAGFMEFVGGCGMLANHLTVFACETHYDDDGQVFGPDWSCQYCGMDLAWPGGEKKCPGCLHMASLGKYGRAGAHNTSADAICLRDVFADQRTVQETRLRPGSVTSQ